jgi:hypothetical protein
MAQHHRQVHKTANRNDSSVALNVGAAGQFAIWAIGEMTGDDFHLDWEGAGPVLRNG